MKFVIIGGGIAGTSAAEQIRQKNKDAEIIIIDRENYPCYSRVLLMPYVID
ncbi:NAD(P)/FAD-dependent oxidoreductase, partial [Candidatus Parcubacteria bacterium]